MPDTFDKPLRLRIQEKIIEVLKEISPANGFKNDLSLTGNATCVFRGRFWFGDNDPLPLVSLLQTPLQPEDMATKSPGNPNKLSEIEFVIQGWVRDDRANPTDPAEYLLADVEKRLAQVRQEYIDGPVLGFKSVTELWIGEGVVRPPDDISAKAYFWLPIKIKVARNLADPYNDN